MKGDSEFDDPLTWWRGLDESRRAFDEETSGFFLVEQGRLPDGFRSASRGETEPIRGKCVYATTDGNATRPPDVCEPCKGGGAGMARYAFHLMRASLSLYDNPVGYSPPLGPEVRFTATYNQREENQPTTFSYSNLGTRWVHNWMSYVEDDPAAVGDPIELNVREVEAGSPTITLSAAYQRLNKTSGAVMTIVSTNPIEYERELPDGSVEVFAESDGAATAPRKVFLTELKDPQGNALTFTYDSLSSGSFP